MAGDVTWYDGFPTEPIGGGNPYHRCACCRRSVPEINYTLEGHLKDCAWRLLVERGETPPYGASKDYVYDRLAGIPLED